MSNLRRALAALVLSAASISYAQVPTLPLSGTIRGSIDLIGSIADTDGADGNAFKLLYVVPADRVLRLTDLALSTRGANTTNGPCIATIWRGAPAEAQFVAWNRIKVFGNSSYDKEWVSGPAFGAGAAVWIRMQSVGSGAASTLCTRTDAELPVEVLYTLRGYLFTVP